MHSAINVQCPFAAYRYTRGQQPAAVRESMCAYRRRGLQVSAGAAPYTQHNIPQRIHHTSFDVFFTFTHTHTLVYTSAQNTENNSLTRSLGCAYRFKLVAIKLTTPTKEHLEQHYEDLSTKPFFPGLIQCMIAFIYTAWFRPGDELEENTKRAAVGMLNI